MAKKDDGNDNLFCSFCGKNQKEVKKLIAGPAVYICDECIQLCSEIIEEENEKDSGGFENLVVPKEILRMKDVLNQILVHHTSQPLEKIQRDTDRDFFMSGMDAKEYGVVDHVIRNREDLDHLDESEARKHG